MSQNQGQVLVAYSDTRKEGMRLHHTQDCNALITLLKLIMEKNKISVGKIHPTRNSFADLSIDFKVSDEESLKQFQQTIKTLLAKRIGAKSIEISLTPE